MSHQTPTADWEQITPDVAAQYLSRNEGNRRLSEAHVKLLAGDMKRAGYLITGDTIKFDRTGRLIDGQHRLNAIVASGLAQKTLVVRGLDPMVQAVIDAQKRRSAADAISFAFNTPNTTTVAAIARLDMSIRATRNPTALSAARGTQVTNTQVIEWVTENADVLDYARRAHSLANKSRDVRLSPTFGGWLWLNFGRAAGDEKADEFFAPMLDRHKPFGIERTGVAPAHDPRYVFMQAVNRFNGDDRASLKPVVYGVKAWNLWRRGKELRLLRPTTGGGGGKVGIPMPLEVPK